MVVSYVEGCPIVTRIITKDVVNVVESVIAKERCVVYYGHVQGAI